MFDPDLQYCPQCGDEYRAEILKCVSCAVPLVSGRERLRQEEESLAAKKQRPSHISENDELSTIFRGQHIEIKALEEILADERIATLVVGDKDSCGKGCCPTVLHLQVRQQDAEEAVKLIQLRYRLSTGLAEYDQTFSNNVFDQQQNEATCPACGHCFPTSDSTCPDCGLCIG